MELTFRHPGPDEMALRQRWQADPELMSYNAGWDVGYPGYHPETGCIDLPESEWAGEYQRLVGAPREGTAYWFVERDGEIVGHAHHRRGHDADRAVADIGFMVLPAARGEGLGGKILAELVRRVLASGFDVVRNEFEVTREPAMTIHRRLGFQVVPGSEVLTGGRTVVTLELTRRGSGEGG